MAIGDSKTLGTPYSLNTNGYRDELLRNLKLFSQENDVEWSGALVAGGKTTAQTLADFPAFAAAQTQAPDVVLINLGTNDLDLLGTGVLTRAEWKTSTAGLLDAIHTEWPSAKVYCMRVIYTLYPTEQDNMADVDLPDVLSTRSSWAFVGPDERDFLPGFLTDQKHPNVEGYHLTALQWQSILGY